MKRSLFIVLLICQCAAACAPAEIPAAPTATPAPLQSGETLWISLDYFFGQLGTTYELTVTYYDPATYTTPVVPVIYPAMDTFLPHVRFRSADGQVLADVPLKLVSTQDMLMIDGGISAQWEAFVPPFVEYDCLELMQAVPQSLTKVELEPGMRLC